MTKTFGNFTDLMDFSRSTSGTALRKVSYGSELVTNGTFDTDLSGWVTTSTNATNTVTWNSGAVDFVSDGSTSLGLNQYAVFTVGKLYQLKIDVTVNSGNVAGIKVQYTGTDSSIGVITATGSYTFNFIAGGVNLDIYRRTGGSATNVTIDNVSVKEVTLDSGTDDPVVFNHPADIPRIEYATDGTVKGLLIEEARTNYVTYSEAFDNAAWTKASVTVSANATTAPDGTLTADKVFKDNTTAQASIQVFGGVFGSVPVGATTYSFYAKAAEYDTLGFTLYNPTDGHVANGSADLTNGTVVVFDGTIGIENAGNGWWRISGSGTPTVTSNGLYIYPKDSTSYQGDGSSGIYVWGAQVEAGSFATSYIPTSGATATRSADIASIAVENFGYNQDEGTVVVEYKGLTAAPTSSYRVIELSDGTNDNRITLFYNAATDTINLFSVADGDFNNTGSIGLSDPNRQGVVAGAYSPDGIFLCKDGGSVSSDLSIPALTGINTLKIGLSYGLNDQLNGHIRDFQYYPRRLTNRQLQELTGATNTYDYTTVEAGTITRTPVATGADLVAYSGFSATNYLEQPYNSDLDFGTGDFCVMGWVNGRNNNYNCYLHRIAEKQTAAGFRFMDGGSGNLLATGYGSSLSGGSYPTDSWFLACFVRTSGVGYLYINGEQVATGSYTANMTEANATTTVGGYWNNSVLIGFAPALALWRISATAPSAEQIAKIYNDEKVLFQENAQATLYGSSDAVTALAHDDTTNLLHVGTSAGRSVFQGLRRVENTTDAVGTAISASNGLVVEE